jgi:hypothetical protein
VGVTSELKKQCEAALILILNVCNHLSSLELLIQQAQENN